MKSLKHKTVLITGATGGFGKEFVRQLYIQGAHLILTGRDTIKLENIAKQVSQIPSTGRIIGTITSDLSDKDGCEKLYNACIKITPNLDILINNAGIIIYGRFHEIPIERWERLMELNLLSSMRLTYLFLPDMINRKQGHIVLMSSVAGFVGTANSTAYAASKFGIKGFGISLHKEVKSKGINVTIIYPFWADTPLLYSQDYGQSSAKRVIKIVVDKAESVVKESIKGIRNNKLSVYPGPSAKALHFLNKFIQITGTQRKG